MFARAVLVGIAVCGLGSGCASVPYRYAGGRAYGPVPMLKAGEPQIVYGRPNSVVDGLGQLFSIPSKLILWNRRVDSHHVSRSTVDVLACYLATNGLTDVKVRINQYAPGDELMRLVRNRAVNPVWRYTGGIGVWLLYTILPGRVTGGDHYNPFSHTISIYSDHPSIVLHEGAHAKDFTGREYKGTYAAARLLPVVSLYHEAIATGDAVGYLRDRQDLETEKETYRILYPAYGTYVGGELGRFYTGPASYLLNAAFAVPGHIVGRIKAHCRE